MTSLHWYKLHFNGSTKSVSPVSWMLIKEIWNLGLETYERKGNVWYDIGWLIHSDDANVTWRYISLRKLMKATQDWEEPADLNRRSRSWNDSWHVFNKLSRNVSFVSFCTPTNWINQPNPLNSFSSVAFEKVVALICFILIEYLDDVGTVTGDGRGVTRGLDQTTENVSDSFHHQPTGCSIRIWNHWQYEWRESFRRVATSATCFFL